ncbi:unnamed protein product [Blepharisma stoltei]|uniref:protein-L-isoaspartate(D-aspartate) O-methyltransferase n=1 Tax=Blepharisma stoltei TaxID=1481888 RepID=A0AAU9JDT7_9CILI|nr:unnamed protein product [Blepharisma stoltei]
MNIIIKRMRSQIDPRNNRLVQKLIDDGVIKSSQVTETMRSIDRGLFIKKADESIYFDSPHSIGYCATISAPHMHAYALEWLKDYLTPYSHVLDIGSGSGYLTLCMSAMMGFTGKVIGVDHIDKIVEDSIQNIRRSHSEVLSSGAIEMYTADGRNGYPLYAPYKAIHVGAASDGIPQALLDQLDVDGRMVIPVGLPGSTQQINIIDKEKNGKVRIRQALAVSYIPLCEREKQWPRSM